MVLEAINCCGGDGCYFLEIWSRLCMHKLQKLLFCLMTAMFVSGSSMVNAQEFRGVFTMLSEDDTSDLFVVSQVFQRCSGLYGALAKFLPNVTLN